jgi:hypothetical protein
MSGLIDLNPKRIIAVEARNSLKLKPKLETPFLVDSPS